MKAARRKAGYVLFRKGDRADRLYLLASGRVEFVEIGLSVGPGQVFGEIAFFAPHGRRTLTARCSRRLRGAEHRPEHACARSTTRTPVFGFELIGLVAGRLSADIVRLEEQLARALAVPREP